MSSTTTQLSQLIGDSGLDTEATNAMQLTADTLGPDIMAGLGDVSLDDVTSSVLLVTKLLDNSSSISWIDGGAEAVRDGCNLIDDSLRASKQSDSVLITCRTLNDHTGNYGIVYPYVTLEGAQKLDSTNYRPDGITPLYDQTAVTLAAVTAKMAEFEAGGVTARAVTVIVTDGRDFGSKKQRASDIAKMVKGMLRTEQHVIAGMGIDDPDDPTDFRQVFKDMGLHEDWILTPNNSAHEIRQAFQVVSQSAVRASQTASNDFSQMALGGFGD